MTSFGRTAPPVRSFSRVVPRWFSTIFRTPSPRSVFFSLMPLNADKTRTIIEGAGRDLRKRGRAKATYEARTTLCGHAISFFLTWHIVLVSFPPQLQPPTPTSKQTELLMLQILQKYLDLFINQCMDLIGKLRRAQIRAEKNGSVTVRGPFVRNDVMDPAVPQVRVVWYIITTCSYVYGS